MWAAGAVKWFPAGVAPLKPTLAKSAAPHMAAIVRARMRRGVSQERWWVCSHVRKPVAAEAPTIAQPMHMVAR